MTQGELEQISMGMEKLFSALEDRILSDIVRRIQINGFSTASADWQVSRLQQLGESEVAIQSYIQDTLDASDEEMEAIFSNEIYSQYTKTERAYHLKGMEQIPFSENISLQRLIRAVQQQTKETFRNLTQTLAVAVRTPLGRTRNITLMNYYRDTLDAAAMDIHSGAFDYQLVLRRTVNALSASGIRTVDYKTGRSDRIEVVARRAVMTGFRQLQGQINEQVAKDLKTDQYEVTWHGGARPTHQPWQGRVWTYQQLIDVCGLGNVTGLHGVNCYHDYNPFIPGVSIRTYTDEWLDQMNEAENTPKEYNGKQYTTYEALQQQRKLERTMRKYRQDIRLLQEGGGDPDTITVKKAKYKGYSQNYRDFSKKMGLPEQWDRVKLDGLSEK